MNSYALASNFIFSQTNSKIAVLVFLLFSCTTPLGIVVGMVGSGLGRGRWSELVHGVVLSLAGGTFVSVGLSTLIKEDLDHPFPSLLIISLFVGCAVMSLLAIWV